ncbi:MAG: glycoside hydrolase 43 family protein [Mediterranea sp.]|jgi:beta-xylosidase|nr:glycoside hydrolase 43 family protein [Mediterranea sp.]
MKQLQFFGWAWTIIVTTIAVAGCTEQPVKERATNPLIFADVPDMSMVRVGDTYYMSSTTMHETPGVPVMRSTDLTNWEIVSYCYNRLAEIPEMNLTDGKNTYGRGTWASCIRYHNNRFYVSTFAQTTGKTYIFSTDDIEKGEWQRQEFAPSYHDHTLFFDDDGHAYLIWGGGRLRIVQLKDDLSGVVPESERVLIENAGAPAGDKLMLPAEGSQLFKVNGKYYLFNITWPRGGMRTVVIHRADRLEGPWEGRVALQDRGIAQGGLIDTPDGRWFTYLFRDYGSVGRIPYLAPVTWEEGWPVLGVDGLVPDTLDLPASRGLIPGIVASDDFGRTTGEPDLPLVWQWNHQPNDSLWSVNEREGYLRLHTSRIDTLFTQARNTLTQRTIGPTCEGETAIDISGINEGDYAGLALVQRKFGLVGVRMLQGTKQIVMVSAQTGIPEVVETLPLAGDTLYLKATCDFTERRDVADFFYSTDGKQWTKIGSQLKMEYSMPHFMGYRYGLFYYSTLQPGGHADFDYFNIQ